MAAWNEEQAGWVRRVLGVAVPDAAPGPVSEAAREAGREGAAVRLAKGMLLWNKARGHVADQVRLLQGTILQQTRSEPDAGEIEQNLVNLEEVLEVLDDRLGAKLNEMRGSTDDGAKRTLSAEARAIVAEYQAYIDGDELVNGIDDNGFVALDIKPTVARTLAAVLQTI